MSEEAEVGYGKPPKKSRFRKGVSGNPKGRPRGTKNLKTDLTEEMGEQVFLREDGRSRKVSKQRAVLKTLVARTLNGDARAANTLMNTMLRLLEPEQEVAVVDQPLNSEERETLQLLKVRLLSEERTEPTLDDVADTAKQKS